MGGVASAVGSAVGGLGGITNGIAKGFTPQNEYQASNPLDLEAFNAAIKQSQGGFNQNMGQQNMLANTLLQQSQGQGPNPAQAMLNQSTDQNIQQNTGMIASQKGISPALAARLASQNAGSMSQQAAGQAAVMQAQQQLGAQSQLGNLYGSMAGQNLQNIGQSAGSVNSAVNGVNQINAGVSAQNAAATQNTASGGLGGLGGAAMKYAGFANGGEVSASSNIANQILSQGGVPLWASGTHFDMQPSARAVAQVGSSNSDVYGRSQPGSLGVGAAQASPSMLGVGQLGGAPVAVPSQMGINPFVPQFKAGGRVAGRAQVSGDSPENDTVPAMLSPGEIVIPRSAADDPDKARAFVASLQKSKKKDEPSFGKILEAHRKLGAALKDAQ